MDFRERNADQLTEDDSNQIRQAATDLHQLWHAPGVSNADRKEVVRAVLDEITIAIRGVSELVDVTLHWAGGQTTTAVVRRPVQYFEHLSYYPHLQTRVLELADQGLAPAKIADRLNSEGFRPARDDGPIRFRAVDQILHRSHHPLARERRRLPADPAEAPSEHEWWLADLAAELGAPWARSTAGVSRTVSIDARRHGPRTDGSSPPRRTNSPSSAATSTRSAADKPASTPASPTPTEMTHRRILLDSCRIGGAVFRRPPPQNRACHSSRHTAQAAHRG
ncbi:hypothetical protein ABZV25_06435, partial [Micrococcus luteus]